MSARFRLFTIAFSLVLFAAPVARVHAQDATPTPDIHAQHHVAGAPAAPGSSAPVDSDVAGHLLHMQGMLDELAAMELPDAARSHVEHMQGMLKELAPDMEAGKMTEADLKPHLEHMEVMFGELEAMDLPAAARGHVEHMSSMLGEIAPQTPSASSSSDVSGMDMSGMDMSGMMSQMEDMMAMMDETMDREMPADMQQRMKMMRGMMDDMMSGMQDMQGGMMSDGMKDMQAIDHAIPMTGTELALDADAMEAMPGMDHSMPMTSAEPAPDAGTMDGMDHGVSSGAHAMAPVPSAGVPDATAAAGAQPLDFTMDGDVKVFELTAQPVRWPLMEGVVATAWTYNGSVPGPMIRVTEGDKVRVVFKNELPEPTTIHWHGVTVPNSMDGVPGVTQEAVKPGDSFIYEFTAQPSGTYWYHSHFNSDQQIGIGLYAPLIIDPKDAAASTPDVDVTMMLGEWRVVDGETYAAMPMAGMEPNYFTVNGKAFPAIETIQVKKGDRVRLRFINAGQFVHPMHLHGFPFEVVATDGHAVPEAAILTKDTIAVASGERYDVEFTATETGQWMLHCHITHHLTNDGVEPGGLMFMIDVVE